MPHISQAVLEKLRTFDTPTICNLVELFDVRPRDTGYMNARIKAWFPEMPPMVGFAATVTVRASAPPQEGGVRTSLADLIDRFEDLSGSPMVVIQDLDNPVIGPTY